MAISSVVTRGYGPGASIALVVTRGYSQEGGEPAVIAAPGPLFLTTKAYKALQAKRRKAEDELEGVRQAEEKRRRDLREMIGRAVRGEAEPAAEARSGEDEPPAIRESRRAEIAGTAIPADPEADAKIADLARQIEVLKARISAHEDAEEEDDIETLMLLVA